MCLFEKMKPLFFSQDQLNQVFILVQMVDIYDSRRGLVEVGPCKWSPNMEIAFWLSQDDAVILQVNDLETALIISNSRCVL